MKIKLESVGVGERRQIPFKTLDGVVQLCSLLLNSSYTYTPLHVAYISLFQKWNLNLTFLMLMK